MIHARKKQLGFAALSGSILALSAAAPLNAGVSGEVAPTEATYSVTIEHTTMGQWLTPPNFGVHDRSVRVFRSGGHASVGVQAVAENGEVGVFGGRTHCDGPRRR